MQELTQACVAAGSMPGLRPFASPASMREAQKLHFVATPFTLKRASYGQATAQ